MTEPVIRKNEYGERICEKCGHVFRQHNQGFCWGQANGPCDCKEPS